MSANPPTPSIQPQRNVPALRARKGSGHPLVILTAYTTPQASMLDEYVDILLVGDSLGMVMYGEPNTLNVPLEWMCAHGKAVVRGAQQACVIVDMPFGTVQSSPYTAMDNCARVMRETGCTGVKIEGGVEMAETIGWLTSRGVPVMGHVGLMPQHVKSLGGFKKQGKDQASLDKIVADAKAVEQAGAFCVVLEAVMPEVAEAVTTAVSIPVIGIGAGHPCDGQVLVIDDILGLTERAPTFSKQYVNLNGLIRQAAKEFADEVRSGAFPGEAQGAKQEFKLKK